MTDKLKAVPSVGDLVEIVKTHIDRNFNHISLNFVSDIHKLFAALETLTADNARLQAENDEFRKRTLVGYLHTVAEPIRTSPDSMFSYSPESPWGHWIETHLDTCEYSVTPLYGELTELAKLS